MIDTTTVYLLLGSNLGNRSFNLKKARRAISTFSTIQRSSSIYESKSWGKKRQPTYYNQVLEIKTTLGPYSLLNQLKLIERISGRKNKGQMMPRVLDLDILFFNDLILYSKNLILPHSGIPIRKFTLEPLSELIPDFIHPISAMRIKEMLEQCEDKGAVRKLADKDAL